MAFTDYTTLQLAVLVVLGGDRLGGPELRADLEKAGTVIKPTAFYRLMSRLEKAGLVRGATEPVIVDGVQTRVRHYEVTAEGSAAVQQGRAFLGLAGGGASV